MCVGWDGCTVCSGWVSGYSWERMVGERRCGFVRSVLFVVCVDGGDVGCRGRVWAGGREYSSRWVWVKRA